MMRVAVIIIDFSMLGSFVIWYHNGILLSYWSYVFKTTSRIARALHRETNHPMLIVAYPCFHSYSPPSPIVIMLHKYTSDMNLPQPL
jgi:hypothetical protein